MAEKEEEVGEFECDGDHFTSNLILPNGTKKCNAHFNTDSTVEKEKARLIREHEVKMSPDDLAVVLHLDQGKQIVLVDSQGMDKYQKHYPPREVELKCKRSAKDRQGHSARPDEFNYKVK